jgi:hypothetical protein
MRINGVIGRRKMMTTRQTGDIPGHHAEQAADGTITVWTTDEDPHRAEARAIDTARLREAVAAMRAQGVPHPVVLFCSPGGELTPPVGIEGIPQRDPPGLVAYVLTTEQGREALRPVLGKEAARRFRVPSWPVSYWEIWDNPGQTSYGEGRFLEDCPEDERPDKKTG